MTQREDTPVGTVRGPGDSAHEYVFVTQDPEQRVGYGEFVTYRALADGEERAIFGRVSARVPERRYPVGLLAAPGAPPDEIAAMLGYDADLGGTELDAVTATVLGYHDAALGEFVNPRCPPRQGMPVRIAGDAELMAVLGSRRRGEVGSAEVGSLLSRPQGAVPIVLDVRAITSTHLAIIAGTGSGKSYLAGVLLEEMLQPWNRAAVLVIDPHGEYGTLDRLADCEALRGDDGYRPEARIVHPGDIRVKLCSLQRGDFRYLMPEMSERMFHVLEEAIRRLERERRGAWTLDDLLRAVEGSDPTERGEPGMTAFALHWRLKSTFRDATDIFSDHENLRLDDLFAPGRCTVLQLNEVDHRAQQAVVATLLRRLYAARMRTHRGQADEDGADYLPFPVFTLIEEAHNFAPASGDGIATGILKTILGEGRKFGVGVGLISQRPGRLDGDALSQCMTQFLLRIVNPLDQESVSRAVEGVGRDLLRELPALSKGQALMAGRAVNTPVLCRVRQRLTPHGAEDPDAPAAWVEYHRRAAQEEQRKLALPGAAARVTPRSPFRT